MGAPLLAYVQNSVQDVRVRVFSLLVMCGGNAAVRGPATAELLTRNCWRGVCIAASFTWEGEGCAFWIGTADLDRNR